MLVIAQNKHYSVRMDEQKNRLYVSISGEIDLLRQISDFMNDIQSGVGRLRSGFTAIVDVRHATINRNTWPFFFQVQLALRKAGLSKAAELYLPGFETVNATNIQASTGPKVIKMAFDNAADAEEWLDL